MKVISKIFSLCVLTFLLSCSPPAPESEAVVTEDPEVLAAKAKEVVDNHLAAFGANDIEGIMADYTEESVFITPDRTLRGIEQIREMMLELFPMFPTEGTEFTVDNMVVEGNLVYIVWHCVTPFVEAEIGSDTFIIENGKIMQQTFVAVIEPIEDGDDEAGHNHEDHGDGAEEVPQDAAS